MQIKEIPLGRIGLDKQTLVGLSVVAFSSLVGTSKDTVQNALIPIHQGKYAPQPLQHLLNRVFVDGVNPRDRFIRVEAIDDLLHYFGVSSNRFRKPAARDAIAKFADYGGFIPYAYYELHNELDQVEESKVVPIVKSKEEASLFGVAKVSLNIDWKQYRRDAEYSKSNPLPRRVIPLGDGIEVFGLPGFEKKRGRYLLSLTNAGEAVGKIERSIREFLGSKGLKASLDNPFESATFVVENSQKPIIGILPELANLYWIHQLSKGNLQAIALVSAFSLSSLEHHADLEFGINRAKVEQTQRLQELLWRFEAGDYALHFKKPYYDELYRIFPKFERKPGRHPGLFAMITRNYFYELMPGGVHDLFRDRKKTKDEYWHQFLTEHGDIVFDQVMSSFLTFLRGAKPGDWKNFVTQYNNTYSNGFQNELDLFPEALKAA
jgi:hypothetical protein